MYREPETLSRTEKSQLCCNLEITSRFTICIPSVLSQVTREERKGQNMARAREKPYPQVLRRCTALNIFRALS